MNNTKKTHEAGFTLISVMIAMLMLTIGIAAMSRTGFVTQQAHTAAAARTTALEIAVGYMEDLRSRDPGILDSESPVMVDATGQQNTSGPYTRSVVVAVLAKNLKQITVRVLTPLLKNPVELVTLAFVPGI